MVQSLNGSIVHEFMSCLAKKTIEQLSHLAIERFYDGPNEGGVAHDRLRTGKTWLA